jgi:hypothetical protein
MLRHEASDFLKEHTAIQRDPSYLRMTVIWGMIEFLVKVQYPKNH